MPWSYFVLEFSEDWLALVFFTLLPYVKTILKHLEALQ